MGIKIIIVSWRANGPRAVLTPCKLWDLTCSAGERKAVGLARRMRWGETCKGGGEGRDGTGPE